MKTLRIIFSTLFLVAVFQVNAQEKYEIVDGAGYLVLSGKSNTSSWMLKSNQLKGDAQMVMDGEILQHLSRVIVNIDASTIINEQNKRMTRKAQSTLLTDDNPMVTFFAYGFSRINDEPLQMHGNLYMAGKNVDLVFKFTTRMQDEIVWIVAEANTLFSDFGLEPPTDFGGAVQCKDEIKIEVQLPLVKASNIK
ncbi:YceI family protein [Roseivirga sp.]|uniref:YceI family protein n=1 Tax=Roseivirga sp. TaxID=1964215 RepID=UPI003B5187FE